MNLKNNELGYNKPNNNQNNGSYDDSIIKENIREISSQLEQIENQKADKTKADELQSQIDNVENMVKIGKSNYIFNDWERGSLNAGTPSPSLYRIRSADYHTLAVGTNLTLNVKDGFRVAFIFYNEDNTFNKYGDTGWLTGVKELTTKFPKFKIIVDSVGGNIVLEETNNYFTLNGDFLAPNITNKFIEVDRNINNVKNVELNSSIYIPSKIFNLKIGEYKRSFKENVISTYNLDDFRLGHPGDIQYGYYPDYVNISGSSIQLGIYNSRTNELLYSKTISNVVPEIPSNKDIEKNILILGDSYIDRGFLPCKIKDMLVNDYGFTKLNFIGLNSKTINDVTCLNQGRGGATITDYIKTDNSQGQGWNNPFNFNGNISFTQYCNDNSWDGLDIVIINLGVNDLITYGSENKSDIKTKLSQLIDYIHADYPNCMIYVNGLIYVHKENNTKNHIIHNKNAMYINSEYEALLSQDKYSSFCRYVDQGFSFLIDYGFSYKKVKAYPNSLEEVKIITDWLHPSELGFDMMAEADVSCILNDFNN